MIIDRRPFCDKGDARHISVTLAPTDARAFTLHNFYVPAGGDEPDPDINPKFAHKLAFLDEMAAWIAADGIAGGDAVMVGDLNIAPLETDVWNHKALLKVVSHTPIEVEKLGQVFAAGPWVDAVRRYVPPEQKLYTWWSYRSPNWALADKGRRLDHIWTSQSLAPALSGIKIVRESRGWSGPRITCQCWRISISAAEKALGVRRNLFTRRPEVDQRLRAARRIERPRQAILMETRRKIGLIRRLVEAGRGRHVVLLRALRHDIARIEPAAFVDRQRRLIAGIDDSGMMVMLMRREGAGSGGKAADAEGGHGQQEHRNRTHE